MYKGFDEREPAKEREGFSFGTEIFEHFAETAVPTARLREAYPDQNLDFLLALSEQDLDLQWLAVRELYGFESHQGRIFSRAEKIEFILAIRQAHMEQRVFARSFKEIL